MVNDVRAMLHEAVASPAGHEPQLEAILRGGRRRVRRRRAGRLAGGAGVVAASLALGVAVVGPGDEPDRVAQQRVPRPEGPVLRLEQAVAGVAGTDYEVLARHTNKDLDAANGQYFDGLTDDGLIVFRDGPHGPENTIRLGLRDPATGRTDWLERLDATAYDPVPVDLGTDRLVFVTTTETANGSDMPSGALRAHVLDRATGAWRTVDWPTLPDVTNPHGAEIGPDGRLYVGVPATEGGPPPGGWPTGPDGEADDAAAEGDTYDLWSVSLTDAADVRDEKLRVGNFAFTRDQMVWSDRSNGTNDRLHVRDLATGEEHDFDPRSGERCNLLGLSASGDRIVLGQYCGTYDDGRDDRVQVLTTSGDPVTTIQGDGVSGWLADGTDGDGRLVQLSVHSREQEGSYVYEVETGRLVRVTDAISSWGLGGPTPAGHLFWDLPYGAATDPGELDAGATQLLVRWRN